MVRAQQAEEAAERRAREEAERRAERAAQAAQVEQTQSAQAEQKECCICLETVAARTLLVLVPCGHRCVCAGCGDRLVGKPCPICRENVERVMRVYE